MLKTILSALTSRWFLTLVAALCLGAIVWFLGPLVAVSGAFPLEDATIRLAVVFGILLVWALDWLVLSRLPAVRRVLA